MFRTARRALPLALAVAACSAPAAIAGEPLEPVVHELSQTRAEVHRFWTDERVRSAEPAEMPTASTTPRGSLRSAPDGSGKPQSSGHKSPKLPKRKRVRRKGPKLPRAQAKASWYGFDLSWINRSYGYTSSTKAVGRLLYQTPTGPNICSAAVVATNVIVTAAHCVTDGYGRDFSNFEFRPNVYGNSAPFGGFAGRAITYYRAYNTNGGHAPLDYAFVTLHRNSAGYDVAAYTGAYGLWTNAPKSDAYTLGYPGEGAWSSNVNYPWHCKSPIQRYTRYSDGRYDVGMSCYNTGGSSGGPWFQTASDGRTYISSVMSHMGLIHWQNSSCTTRGCPRYGLSFYGPYFNAETGSLLAIARAR